MEDYLEKTYREEMKDLHLDPSSRVWQRLEARLDQDKGKVPARTFRTWISMVASIAILVGAYAIFHEHDRELVIEDLESMPKATFTAYKYVEQCHLIYGSNQWKIIDHNEELRAKGAIVPNPAIGDETPPLEEL